MSERESGVGGATMTFSGIRAKLLSMGLVVATVGLLGVAPTWAQDDSATPEEISEEAAGDEGISADELLAKALELARSIQEGGEAHPPLRVETRQKSAINLAGDLPAGLAPPPLDLRSISLVDSRGSSQYMLADPEYLGDEFLQFPEIFRRMFTVRSEKPTYKIVEGVFYSSTDIYVTFGELLGAVGLDPDTPWVSRVIADIVDEQQDSASKLLGVFFGGADGLSVFSGTTGEAQYIASLLDNSISVSSVGPSDIRGHHTTELSVSISTADLLSVDAFYILETLNTARHLGFDLIPPSSTLISEVLAPDNLLEFRIWIDESGRVHRLVTDYSKVFSSYAEFAFSDFIEVGSEDFEYTIASEFFYLDEEPVIEAPPANEVRAIESVISYLSSLREAAAGDAGDSEGSAVEEPADDGEHELADTGANTPLLAIFGIGVVLAGVMVFALSHRLRAYH